MIRTLLLALLMPVAAQAADLAVTQPFARATLGTGPNLSPGVAYLTITGGDTPDRLLSASTPQAGHVALHSMMMQGDVMRMREVDAIEIPPGATITLKPGGLHMMLEGLKSPLKQGETLPLTLHFEKAGDRTIQVPIAPPGATAPSPSAKGPG